MAIRIVPCRRFDIRGREAFLEQCAREGLHLTRLGVHWAGFKKGEPREVRYRLEAIRGKWTEEDLPEELQNFYQQSGWELVCGTDGFNVFRSEDLSAPEPYNDEESQAESLRWIEQAEKKYARARVVSLAILVLLVVVALLHKSPWYLVLFAVQIPLVCQLWLILMTVDSVLGWKQLKEVRASLEAGAGFPKMKPAKTTNILKEIVSILCIMVLIPCLIVTRAETEISAEETHIITELEQIYPVEWDYGDRKISGMHLLAPVQRQYEEAGLGPGIPQGCGLPGVGIDYQTIQYHPHLTLVEYRLTLPFLKGLIARAEMENLHFENLTWNYQKIQAPSVDLAILAEAGNEEPSQMLALAKGSRLVVYRYLGAERLTEHLELLSSPLQ